MIYTVTANPSLDYIMHLESFIPGATNRVKSCALYPGGKGINVSTMLARLNNETTALGFTAGMTGNNLVEMLKERGFQTDFISCSGQVRINVKLKAGIETEINGTGLEVSEKNLNAMKEKVSRLTEDDVLILSGSIPSKVPDTFYRQLLARVPSGTLTVVDASGKLLENTLESRPFLIKPNLKELEELVKETLETTEEIYRAAAKLQEKGARNVLVSLGDQGAVLAAEDGKIYTAGCPQGKLVNSVGSGDSMTAGFISEFLKTGSFEEALKAGIYAGSATAFTSDLAGREDIETLKQSRPVTVTIITKQ